MKDLMDLGIITEGLEIFRKEGPVPFLRRAYTYVIIRYARMFFIVRKFRATARNLKSINEAVDLAFSFNFLGVSMRPKQVLGEILSFLRRVEELNPKVTLEIGTAEGGTLFLLCRASHPRATIISVDLPHGRFGGGGSRARTPLLRSFSKDKQKISLIKGDSHDSETLKQVKEILAGRAIDLLFIDGDHTYEGVMQDFKMYAPLVRKNGIVAFHDIVQHPYDTGVMVNKFWHEVKSSHGNLELVKDWKQNWAGIGVLYV